MRLRPTTADCAPLRKGQQWLHNTAPWSVAPKIVVPPEESEQVWVRLMRESALKAANRKVMRRRRSCHGLENAVAALVLRMARVTRRQLQEIYLTESAVLKSA
jgi:hypothetical protein